MRNTTVNVNANIDLSGTAQRLRRAANALDGGQAQLGYATTAELLEELAVRMEVSQNSTAGDSLGSLCREALANLDGGVLAYSTMGECDGVFAQGIDDHEPKHIA